MTVERFGKIKKVDTTKIGYINSYKGYIIINPISFSPDSRYFLSRLDTYATSTDYFKAYAFFDTQQDNKYLRISPCKDDQFGGEFKYFSSAVEVVFECNLGSKQFTEKINIKTLEYSRKQISTQNHPKKNPSWNGYGSILKAFTILH